MLGNDGVSQRTSMFVKPLWGYYLLYSASNDPMQQPHKCRGLLEKTAKCKTKNRPQLSVMAGNSPTR